MTTFTPGPWKLDGNAVYLSRGNLSDEEACANARLISAAPDMYEALKFLLRVCPASRVSGSEYWHACKNAARAINKAEGRNG